MAGAAIPSAATIIDFSLGCALAIVGVAVSQKDPKTARAMVVLFSSWLLILIVIDAILRYRWSGWEAEIIVISDIVALISTARAMED